MRKVFESHRQEKVGHFHSILEQSGIASMIKNDASASIDGIMPGELILPELWVMEDDDYDRAIEILTPFYEGTAGDGEGSGGA